MSSDRALIAIPIRRFLGAAYLSEKTKKLKSKFAYDKSSNLTSAVRSSSISKPREVLVIAAESLGRQNCVLIFTGMFFFSTFRHGKDVVSVYL